MLALSGLSVKFSGSRLAPGIGLVERLLRVSSVLFPVPIILIVAMSVAQRTFAAGRVAFVAGGWGDRQRHRIGGVGRNSGGQ
jgi:hypothetical protein